MSVLNHYRPVKEWRSGRKNASPVQSSEIIVNKVEISAFTWIVSQSEVCDHFIICIHILNQRGG